MSLEDRIPNNVDLSRDGKLQRALEAWQPRFLEWWMEMGPDGFQRDDIYLRTAISVDADGWANFDWVRMPEYRWGIFLSEADRERRVPFGDHAGEAAFQEVPGEFRNILRRIIVTQADTEPASVEQQRRLGKTCPSLYDLRNLFQVNVEEGRHLWAMVYLLHSFFGRDGREEAEELLARRAGNADKPRILEAFNQPCEDWLSFFAFTMFVDRDGKYQLGALAESGFDPLARTCRFMLTEEAHHLFVGETGIGRIVRRAAELRKLDPAGDVRRQGGIDIPTVQRFINFWYSYALDLFGGEISSNAADFFAAGLKGRFREERQYTDHRALDGVRGIPVVEDGVLRVREVPLRNALNEVLRDEYVKDCERALATWNRILEEEGVPERLRLPDRRFHRHIGLYAGQRFDTEGHLVSPERHAGIIESELPSAADRAYVASLMTPVAEPGKFAHWIAPPAKGVNGRPLDFPYVRFN